jgi:hypothetical protein
MAEDMEQLREWTAELARTLGVDIDVDVPRLLDLARDAARAVDRRAAPVTTFLVGFAAASNGADAESVQAAAEAATALAIRWGAPQP